MPEGFLLVDKPSGPTSHDVVDRIRRLLNTKRVGHAGTLDPFATGLLILGIGPATKSIAQLVGLDKTYEAEFILGATSATDDPEGPVLQTGADLSSLTEATIKQAILPLTGDIQQIPPNYAAIKIGGKKLYELARAGKPVEAPPRAVRINEFSLIDPIGPIDPLGLLPIRVRIRCSSGTYIRALARDLGASLGVGGYVRTLRRTSIGPFDLSEASPLRELTPESAATRLLPLAVVSGRIQA